VRSYKPYTTMEKVGLVVATAYVAWTLRDLYIYYFRRPDDETALEVADAASIEVLAEECVVDMPIDQAGGLQQRQGVTSPECSGAEGTEEGQLGEEVVLPIKDSTPRLEVRESRGVHQPERTVYIRKVLDECKAKFGTPKVTEANHKAVWHYAHGLMKNHGVRPSHRAEMLPYVVQMTFVESAAELRAGVTVAAYKAVLSNRFDEHLSRVERWSRKLARSIGLA